MKNKRVLVTGGAGFIGSHTTEALLASGADVTVFDDFSAGKMDNLKDAPQARIVRGDIRDLDAVRKVMQGMDAVMHLAAQISVRLSVEDPVNSAQHNVSGFIHVLQAARESGVARVVFASSAAVYGVPRLLPLDESSAVGPISPYGLEKLIDEQYASLFHDLYGLNCMGLRYFNVYGPRQDPTSQYAGVISKFAAGMLEGRPLRIFGTGQQTRDFVFVKDIARANVAALGSTVPGVVAVGTGRSVTLLDLVAALGRCTGRSAEVVHESAVTGDIQESAMIPAKLERTLGFVPATTLDEGLKSLLA